MKITLFVSRILAGLVFVFSGFVKAVDPIGSAIKFKEYFQAFHLDFLAFAALPLAILLCTTELMIGLNLLAGVRIKFTAWLLMLFMTFFSLLTFVLAISNPVSDCGCFGDALKLTNWQTFGKNLVLLIPVIIVFKNRNLYNPFSGPSLEWIMVMLNFIFSCSISVFSIRHQPILDFRPYKVGTNIPGNMNTPEGAQPDLYETLLIYEKNGRKQEFTDKNFPWQDTTWKWVETRQTLIKKGAEPPIHDFSITAPDGQDITSQVLSDSGYVFLIIAPDLEKASKIGMHNLNTLTLKCRELGFAVHGLTASTNNQIRIFKEKYQPVYDLCTADETTLKTIVRANPGVLLLKQGTILGKWNYRDSPSAKELNSEPLSLILSKQQRQIDILKIVSLAFILALIYSCASRRR
jgi:uncharacterized membrane protein YphA (DoxX/SURF4 family)